MVRNVPSRSESNQASADAATELEAQAAVVHDALPTGLRIEWLGVSGYRLTFENRELFIDPYLSRVPLSSLLLRRTALPDGDMVERFCPAREGVDAVGVLVGHTHFDHAVDAPELARRFGCNAYGSESLQRLMGLHGLGEETVVVTPYETYELSLIHI